jgi:hypothetical protein
MCLISIGRITDQGYCALFADDGFSIINAQNKTTVATGTRYGKKLYSLDGTIIPRPTAHVATTQLPPASLETWHAQLGHISVSTIHKIAEGEMAKGMPVDLSMLPPSCKHCILGKQTRTPVPKMREHARSTRKLRVVYADLTGPEAVESKRRNYYSMEVVDEYTNMTWCIPLHTKDQAFCELKRCEKEWRQECGEEVGIYRVDSRELKSHQMRDWLANAGTKLQMTAPYTSAHIGMVERRHRTMFELARAMRSACMLPANLWDYFVETAGYIAQRRPTKYQHTKTPFDVRTGSTEV